jgi:6-phosphogluconolactonase (cycloisomerase 2 family)
MSNIYYYAYVIGNGSNTIDRYTIGSTGILNTLTALTPANINSPTWISWTRPATPAPGAPSGTGFLYVTNSGNNTVSMYTTSQSNGSITPLSTATISTGNNPILFRSISITDGSTTTVVGIAAYVLNQTDKSISQYSLDSATGTLSALSTPTVSNGGLTPIFMTTNSIPNSSNVAKAYYAYVLNNNNTISQYSISNTSPIGQLTALSPATVATGNGATNIIGLSLHPNSSSYGLFIYVCNVADKSITVYSANTTTGVLT